FEVECSQSEQLQMLDSLDDGPNVSLDLSASADFDPLNQTSLTPSKRSPVQEKDDDILTAQQSSTRLIKGGLKLIVMRLLPKTALGGCLLSSATVQGWCWQRQLAVSKAVTASTRRKHRRSFLPSISPPIWEWTDLSLKSSYA
ncbi:hypothetical protein A2U01_0043316, partial [Trifolium medium]|nr:hypothetical protein [Trifolium medium]